jgi:hypothetical protein
LRVAMAGHPQTQRSAVPAVYPAEVAAPASQLMLRGKEVTENVS